MSDPESTAIEFSPFTHSKGRGHQAATCLLPEGTWPMKVFSEFWDDGILKTICTSINLYAHRFFSESPTSTNEQPFQRP